MLTSTAGFIARLPSTGVPCVSPELFRIILAVSLLPDPFTLPSQAIIGHGSDWVRNT
ncbi:hypothetical protein MCC01971_06540 [Bifidobacteriaceae bacterium MCC01971]|nr:hypothetical protein MCC01971_06540 [Bifidobacteriaceae bacterium MCC01971]